MLTLDTRSRFTKAIKLNFQRLEDCYSRWKRAMKLEFWQAGQRVGEDEHPIDQGQTEQAQVHSVLQTCTEERSTSMMMMMHDTISTAAVRLVSNLNL